MFYPTVLINETIHAVADESSSLCGSDYKYLISTKKKILKLITFKNIEQINCYSCQKKIRALIRDNIWKNIVK